MVNLKSYFEGKEFYFYEIRKIIGEIEECGKIINIEKISEREVLFKLEFNSRKKNEEVLFAVVSAGKRNKNLSDTIYQDTGKSILIYSESEYPWKKGKIKKTYSEFFYK